MIFEKIQEIIISQFNVEKDEVNKDTSFQDDLKADSLDLIELIMAIEDEFDLEVEDEDMLDIVCVGDVVEYISKALED
ncbi:MAG TPA: acyl carrier protein [Tissierellaceae bacterium]|nr:acyl carrier protein [Tissierellaceae bacterium]